MKNPNMAKIVYKQMLTPTPINPAPLQKLRCKSPRAWGQILGTNPRGCAGGIAMAKIDSRIIFGYFCLAQSIGDMATSAGNGDVVGNGDINFVTPLS